MIPTLEGLVRRLQLQFLEMKRRLAGIEWTALAFPAEEVIQRMEQDPQLVTHFREFLTLVAEIQKWGCQLKGLEIGLVDFPAVVEDQVAYLCWQLGEKEICYWHSLEEGFQGRRPLDSSLLEEKPAIH